MLTAIGALWPAEVVGRFRGEDVDFGASEVGNRFNGLGLEV